MEDTATFYIFKEVLKKTISLLNAGRTTWTINSEHKATMKVVHSVYRNI